MTERVEIPPSKCIVIGDKQYTIRRFKPTDGRRIVAGYPLTAAPKIGDYNKNEELMVQLMSYVSVHLMDGSEQPLVTKALIDNHVPSWNELVEIEYEVLKFNCPFLQNGGMQSFVDMVKDVAANYIVQIMASANSKVE